MGQISESYASPGLRLGLLLEDHPDASYTFELRSGEELGIPARFGGDGDFCVCTITAAGKKASAYKPVPSKGDADLWNILCTKTLGRALKRAGYPDDLHDLKALVLWRQRNSEIAAISGGAQLSLPSASAIESGERPDPVQRALEAAAVADPEQTGQDEGDGAIEEAEVVPSDGREMVAAEVANLSKRDFANWLGYLKTIGAPEDIDRMTDEQTADVLGWLLG